MTPCPDCNWPHHAAQPAAFTCVKCGAIVVIGDAPPPKPRTRKPTTKSKPPAKPKPNPRWFIRWIGYFRRPEDIGLGDTVERLLTQAGAERVKKLLDKFGLDCGCSGQKAKLNRRFPY